LTSFRPNQLAAIIATLEGKDVFVLMPTGGGKSLCYQLPAVCESGKTKGVTVVISPLKSLMEDQVESLQRKNIDVVFFSSDQSLEESDEARRRLVQSGKKPSMLYLTPEKLQHSDVMKRALEGLSRRDELARFVIDEAHCISSWGRHFRDSYGELAYLRENFAGVPIMALTATATGQAKTDIIAKLNIAGCVQVSQSFNRPNLNYVVLPKKKGFEDEMVAFIQRNHPNQSGIIYCNSKQKCEELAKRLRDKYRLPARHYHAGVHGDDKRTIMNDWKIGRCKIIVATIALGMGIDKADVRFIIHQAIPKSLEGYYQETGRAGRDGELADCMLYFSLADSIPLYRRIEELDASPEEKENQRDDLRRVIGFCFNDVDCRRKQVLAFFGETFDPVMCQGRCDNCRNTDNIEAKDVSLEAANLLKLADAIINVDEEQVTQTQLVNAVRGMKGAKGRSQPLFGFGKDLDRTYVERIIGQLETDGIFMPVSKQNGSSNWSTSYLAITRKASDWMRNPPKLMMRFRQPLIKRPSTSTTRRRRAPAIRGARDESSTMTDSNMSRKAALDDDPIDEVDDDNDDAFDMDDIMEMPSPKKAPEGPRRPDVDSRQVTSISELQDDDSDFEQLHLHRLRQLRLKIAEEYGVSDPNDIIGDNVLKALSTVLPEDPATFDAVLENLEVTDQMAPYATRFLNFCTDAHMNRQNNYRSSRSKPPSIPDLRDQFVYQNHHPRTGR